MTTQHGNSERFSERFSEQFMRVVVLLGCLAAGLPAAADDGTETVSFEKEIAPILQTHCLRCHNDGNAKGDLSLTTLKGLTESEYIVSGQPDDSYLLEVVTVAEGEQRPSMPKEGEPLSDEQVALLRRWITSGAEWPDGLVLREQSKTDGTWWSLQPVADVGPPPINEEKLDSLRTHAPDGIDWSAWSTGPIDRFVLAKLIEKGLTPNPPAEKSALIRRLSYDLTGLPPSPEEVEAFL
ncbi:MAG: DUF1549 domain-containing protein, partial [Maioricimonas sp. JB045]